MCSSDLDMHSETFPLPFRCILVPVVVETCFPNCQNPFMRSELAQGIHVGICPGLPWRLVGVDTDRCVKILVAFSQSKDFRETVKIDADAQAMANAVRCHSSENCIQMTRKFGKIKMAVGVNNG